MAIDNVVKFPKAYNGPENEESFVQKINTNMDMMKHFHIQETIATITPMIFTQLEIAGFPLGEEESGELVDIKDGALVIEALRSIMCKQYEIYHPFQKIAENISAAALSFYMEHYSSTKFWNCVRDMIDR